MAATSSTAERPAETKDATSPAKPVARFAFNGVSAAVFAEEAKTKDGKSTMAYNVSLRRSYKNTEGKWEHARTFRPVDLLPASLALQKCFEYIADANRDDEERQ